MPLLSSPAPSSERQHQTATKTATTKVKTASSDGTASGSPGGGRSDSTTTAATTTTPETPMTTKVEVSSDGDTGNDQTTTTTTATAPEPEPETMTATATATQQQQQQQQQRQTTTTNRRQQEQQQRQQPTLMLVCTTDGRIYSMDAWTGEYHSDTFEQAAGPPLMTRSQAPPVVVVEDDAEMISSSSSSSSSSGPSDFDDDSTTSSRSSSSSASSMIIPGMDGRLYWQQPVAETEESSFELQIQELPLTIHNLLSQPVRTCPDAGESHLDQQCGVLSATAHTSFLALSERGELLWKSNFDATTTPRQAGGAAGDDAGPSSGSNNNNVLILQRKDYWIQEVSMATGQLKWNASVGSYRAVVFDEEVDLDEYDDEEEDDEEDDEEDGAYDDDDDGLAEEEEADEDDKVLSLPPAEKNGRRGKATNDGKEGGVNAALPAVFFSNRGRSVSAVNPDTMEVLWSSDFIQNRDDAADTTVIAAVFGIYKGEWRDLVVLDSEEDDEEGDEEQGGDEVIPANRQLPAKVEGQKESREFDYFDYFGIDEDDYGDDDTTTTGSRTSSLYAKQLSKLQQQHLVRLRQKPEQRQCPGASLRSSSGECVLTLPAASQQQQQRQQRQQEQTATTTVAQPPEGGLFLSWSTIICLAVFGVVLIVAVVVLVVRAVLRRQRREEEETKNAKAGNDVTTPNTSSSTAENSSSERSGSSSSTAAAKASRLLSSQSLPPGDELDHPKAMKRSSSLPGFIRNSNSGNNNGDLHQTESLRRILPSSQDGDDAKGEMAKDSARRPSPDGALGTDKQQQQQQTVVMSPAGIPLIKYSRYATEFEQVRPLGRGGFGTVFECKNALDGRSYAMKKVYIEGTAGTIQSRLQRVLREVKILAMLDHPHIVRYYTAWLEFEEEADDRQRRAQQTTNNSSGLPETDCLSSRPKRALRRFSSSFLCTDNDNNNQNSATVSEWTVDQQQSSQQQFATHQQHRRRFSNSTFQEWSITKESHRNRHEEDESDSWLPPGRQAYVPPPPAYNNNSASDCGIYFADSETNDDDCDADGAGKEKRQDEEEKTVCFSPSRGEKRSTSNRPSTCPTKEAEMANVNSTNGAGNDDSTLVRYTLYIQMQLCSQKTVADFLARTQARITPGGVVDAQTALGLFFQIVQAVEHVHKQGLIHRDLKPSNCFMDEAGNVKVGDFGLSRETSGAGGCGGGCGGADNSETPTPRLCDSFEMMSNGGGGDYDLNHTAGVGTRSYASPEQMKGSDYDSMTDIYSLGIMLFELCFPMSTGMERNIVLGKLRAGGKEGHQPQQQPQFPPTWHSVVGGHFPALQELITSMLQHDPARRPAAAAVSGAVHSILGEFTIVSIDRNHRQNPNVILLRIETEDRPSALSDTCEAIREDASSPNYEVDIVQYGLRTGNASATVRSGSASSSTQQQQERQQQRPTTAIMEFAIQQKRIRRSRRCRRRQEDQNGDGDNDGDDNGGDEEEEEEEEEECGGGGGGSLGTRAMQIVAKLNRRPAIRIARQVSHCGGASGGSPRPRHRASSSAGGGGAAAASTTTTAASEVL